MPMPRLKAFLPPSRKNSYTNCLAKGWIERQTGRRPNTDPAPPINRGSLTANHLGPSKEDFGLLAGPAAFDLFGDEQRTHPFHGLATDALVQGRLYAEP